MILILKFKLEAACRWLQWRRAGHLQQHEAFIRYMISSNIGEVASIFLTAAFGPARGPDSCAAQAPTWVNAGDYMDFYPPLHLGEPDALSNFWRTG